MAKRGRGARSGTGQIGSCPSGQVECGNHLRRKGPNISMWQQGRFRVALHYRSCEQGSANARANCTWLALCYTRPFQVCVTWLCLCEAGT
jgi:hypothetical protein